MRRAPGPTSCAPGFLASCPEEVDPETGDSLGNVPLVWSHAEAARAMYVLDAATLRARFGTPAPWAWRIVRYVRLRWPRHGG